MQNTTEFILVLQQFFSKNIIYALAGLGGLLYIRDLSQKERRTAILAILAFSLLIFNPIVFECIVLKFNFTAEYYRFFWIMPYHIAIAYLIWSAIQQVKNANIRFIYVCVTVMGIVLLNVQTNDLKLPDNSYQIPDETLEVAETLKQLASEENEVITVLADNTINNTIRQYDSHIRLPFNKYTFGGVTPETNTETIEGFTSMLMYNQDNLSANSIRKIIDERHIDYLVISINNGISLSYMEHLHWQIVATTSAYHILQYQEPVFCAEPLTAAGLETEEVEVVIPGLTEEYHFLFLADLHIITENDEISPSELENIQSRLLWSSVSDGATAAEYWGMLPDILDSCSADAVLFGGDMIDFCSSSNVACLKQGLDRIITPYLYVRADHDLKPYWCQGITEEQCQSLHSDIGETDNNPEVWCMELPELCVAGINNSTEQISENALQQMKEIFSKGKPVILLTHVPFQSLIDDSLQEASKEVWQDRALVWGEDCNYRPDENTKKIMDMIYAKDSPVKEIVCGHLHFSWDGYITENTHEHVFSPAFSKKVGVITVRGE